MFRLPIDHKGYLDGNVLVLSEITSDDTGSSIYDYEFINNDRITNYIDTLDRHNLIDMDKKLILDYYRSINLIHYGYLSQGYELSERIKSIREKIYRDLISKKNRVIGVLEKLGFKLDREKNAMVNSDLLFNLYTMTFMPTTHSSSTITRFDHSCLDLDALTIKSDNKVYRFKPISIHSLTMGKQILAYDQYGLMLNTIVGFDRKQYYNPLELAIDNHLIPYTIDIDLLDVYDDGFLICLPNLVISDHYVKMCGCHNNSYVNITKPYFKYKGNYFITPLTNDQIYLPIKDPLCI